MNNLLEVKNISVSFDGFKAVNNLSFRIGYNEIKAVIGPNGAGKSTLLMTISGVNKAKRGNIVFNGENIENREPHKIVDMGICQVPEGRRIFSKLTVEENLKLGSNVFDNGKNYLDDIRKYQNSMKNETIDIDLEEINYDFNYILFLESKNFSKTFIHFILICISKFAVSSFFRY